MGTDVVFADVGVVELEAVVEDDDGDPTTREPHVVHGQHVQVKPRQ